MTPADIKTRREEAGMAPEDLASVLGISTRTLGRWESGESSPKKSDLIAMDVVFSEEVGSKSPRRPARKSNSR